MCIQLGARFEIFWVGLGVPSKKFLVSQVGEVGILSLALRGD